MKSFFLPVIVWGVLTGIGLETNAQIGVTKVGTGALTNNNASGIYNTGVGYYSLNSNTSGNKNTGLGANTLRFNTTGYYNTASGYAAMYFNTGGGYNSAYGLYSMFSNTGGYYNSAYGTYSLQANQVGSANTAIGYSSLYSNKASNNTAIGHYSLYANSTGLNNVGMGVDALYANTTGSNNTGVGTYSLMQNTTGGDNTATGMYALSLTTTGFANAAVGMEALYSNTTGYQNTASGFLSMLGNTTGGNNVASGVVSLYQNTSGNNNVAAGYGTLATNSTGSFNTAIGSSSLISNSTGVNNSAFGNYALVNNQTGSHNTAIGDSADVTVDRLTNATAIGYKAKVDRSNKVRIGNTSVTSIGGQVGWTTFSDGRFKNNITENVPGLAFINSLRPVSYTVNVSGLEGYFEKGSRKAQIDNKDITATGTVEDASRSNLEKSAAKAASVNYNGFLAQEVEAAAKKINFDFSGVDKPETSDGLYGLRYDNFIAPLVKAVQELSRQNSDLKKEMESLKAIVQAGNHAPGKGVILTDASLEQNTPNPFNKSTTIRYSLPQQSAAAKIVITDKDGSTLKEISVSGKGSGSVNVDASLLSSGAYNYSLVVDGKMIGTKQMLMAR